MNNQAKKMSREDFAPILEKTISTMDNKKNIIINGFRTCGLYPFSPENINFCKYFKSAISVTHEENKIQETGKDRYKEYFNFLEKEIPEKIKVFREQEQEWCGPVEDTNLYYFWKNIAIKAGHSSDTLVDLNNDTPELGNTTDNLITEVLDEMPSFSNLLDTESNIFIPLENEEFELFDFVQTDFTPQKNEEMKPIVIRVSQNKAGNSDIEDKMIETTDVKEGKEEKESPKIMVLDNVVVKHATVKRSPLNEKTASCNLVKTYEKTPEKKTNSQEIPTPFKKCLFWSPKSTKENSAIKRREKIPSVASSEQWRDYHKKKAEEKENKEKEKEKRKLEREMKNKTKQKTISKTPKYERCKSTDHEIKNNQYVIVAYDGILYPGLIVELNIKEKEMRIKTMEKSGMNWKWPDRDDILWYKEESVVAYIEQPRKVTKRGSYYIKEMSDYVQ